MDWRRRQYIWLILLSLLTVACDMREDVDINLPVHEGELIVECYLEPGNPYRALVTKSVDFFETAKLEGVDNATVTISSQEGTHELINFIDSDSSYQKIYNYGAPDTVEFQEGAEYTLTVKLDGEVKAAGKARFLPKVSFGNYQFKYESDSMAALFVEVEDNPSEENYYRLVVRGTNPSHGITTDDIWTDQHAENGKLTIYTPYRLKVGWSRVVVNLYHIDKAYYKFLESVKSARDANYNPFMQPASLQSSVEGATGIFTAISLSSDTIRIPPR